MIEPGRWTAVAVVSDAAGSIATDSVSFFAVDPNGTDPSSYNLNAAACQDVTNKNLSESSDSKEMVRTVRQMGVR